MESLPQLSANSVVRLPRSDDTVEHFISRWSNTNVSLPAAVIEPATEKDISSIIKFAAAKGFKVIPAAGTHASFVRIDDKCIYVDMRHFNSVHLDEAAGSVAIGGGVVARDVLQLLSKQGWYTSVPNSNAVGMVGYCLGGGSSPFNGLKGLAIDNILAVRLITAAGQAIDISPDSSGEDAALFNVFCGAGYGLGVVVSLTLRAWRIKDLRMQNDEMWTRKLLFAPPAIGTAAELFTKLQSSCDPRMTVTMLWTRAPPSAPTAGASLILVNVGFFGPVSDAERAAAATFDPLITSQPLNAASGSQALDSMNDAAEPLNRHGDFKEAYATWVSSVPVESLIRAFESWSRFGEDTPDAKPVSYVVFAAKDPKGMKEQDLENKRLFPRAARECGVFVQVVPWWTSNVSEPQARRWAKEMLEIVSAASPSERTAREHISIGFAANLSKGVDLKTVWPKDKVEEIVRVKEMWDKDNIFWNPVIDGI